MARDVRQMWTSVETILVIVESVRMTCHDLYVTVHSAGPGPLATLRSMNVMLTHVNMVASVMTSRVHTNVPVNLASLDKIVRSTLMIVSMRPARMVALVLTEEMISSASVSHHLMARLVKENWIPVLTIPVSMEPPAHPMATITSTDVTVLQVTLATGVRWTLMSAPPPNHAAMEQLVSTPMVATLVSVPEDMRVEIV